MMSKVFVLMDQQWINPRTREWESKFDFSTAEEYGELVFLLPPGAKPYNDETNGELKHALSQITDDDYILPTGSPSLILLAGVYSVLAQSEITRINVLEWDRGPHRSSGRYIPLSFPILE